MNKSARIVACVLAAAFSIPALAVAQSPFDGTWHTDLGKAKLSPKPNVFYLSQGWYHCVSCNPAYDVKADGTDQPVTGQAYDTVSVSEVDPKSISVTAKKAGKAVFEQTRSVSADGKLLTVKTTSHPMNSDQPITTEVTAKLSGVAPAGVHATSGSWVIDKLKESDNGLDMTLKTSGDEITMTEPTGESYTAKLDGTDAPYKGSYNTDTVSVKKIDAHTLEETDKRGGQVIEVDKMTVAGKKLTVVATNKLTDRTSTYIATKK
ncbi:MAG: hypothetical protein WBV28_18275 [Terracidiphilus sp.]